MTNLIETSTGLSLDKFEEIMNEVIKQNESGNAPFYTWQRLVKSIEGIKDDFDFPNMDSKTIAQLILDIDANLVII